MKKNSLAVIKRILAYTRPYTGYLLLALFSTVIQVTMVLRAPILIGEGIDFIVGKGDVDFPAIARTLISLGLTIVIASIFQWIMSLCTNKVTYGTVKDIRMSAFDKINKVPLKYIDGHSHGDIISRVVNDIDQISDGLLQGFTQLFSGIVTIIGTIVFMLTISYKITLVVVLITPLSLFVASFIAKHSFAMFREQSATRGELSGYVEEMIGNQKIIKAFSYEKKAQSDFEEINGRLYRCGVKAQFFSAMTNPCTRFVNGIVFAAVGVTGALSAVSGTLTIGQLSSFLAYANQYTKPFNEITGVITELQTAFASARRVFAVLDEVIEPSDDALPTLETCDGTVLIKDVSFSYNPQVRLIEDLNLQVKAGQRIAIVGPTGCGKTTIINLLMRFYDVTAGSITVDGHDIRHISRQDYRKQFGMVLQDAWLYEGTIKENLRFGNLEATDEEIVEAAKAANVDHFIRTLPGGYNMEMNQESSNISLGQKQLLTIARALLADPKILILDEATSSVDTRLELLIQKAMKNLMKGRTSFVIAHRLSTIQEADKIFVLKDGQIIEQGNHQSLLADKGFYYELYNSQFSNIES